ncbi:MAG: bifunctional phosphopantothenoylcysteine decarboxylase/phosphopantothenate--cysteine ligase CoaBC [bacterium]
MLSQKNIILGVTGSIAAYKSAEILRRLCQLGASVTVVMTQNATRFVSPLTFQTLSRKKTFSQLFDEKEEFRPEHIALSQIADLLLVAPATANIIGKFSAGVADDLLTSLFLSVSTPVLLAPAMNPAMYASAFVQRNLRLLKESGIDIIEPAVGEVACGESGQGRLAETEEIIERVCYRLAGNSPLRKQRILITAGPTREYLDPIRYISNGSSGKMGFALAKAACRRGAEVTLISGPTNLSPPDPSITFVPVVTTREMMQAVEHYFPDSSIVIMAAAVCDFQPSQPAPGKIEKHSLASLDSLKLKNTPDILKRLGHMKKDQILIGFAAETEEAVERAKVKLQAKNLDLICVNDISQEGAGFDVDTNIISMIDSRHQILHLPLMSKGKAAEEILNKVEALLCSPE